MADPFAFTVDATSQSSPSRSLLAVVAVVLGSGRPHSRHLHAHSWQLLQWLFAVVNPTVFTLTLTLGSGCSGSWQWSTSQSSPPRSLLAVVAVALSSGQPHSRHLHAHSWQWLQWLLAVVNLTVVTLTLTLGSGCSGSWQWSTLQSSPSGLVVVAVAPWQWWLQWLCSWKFGRVFLLGTGIGRYAKRTLSSLNQCAICDAHPHCITIICCTFCKYILPTHVS